MNAEQVLAAAFVDHEDLAPDPDEVLDAVRCTLAGRRRRAVTRSCLVLGAAAAVAVVAVAAAGIGSDPTRQREVATRSSGTHPATSHAATQAPAVPAPDHLTIAAGWLPSTRARTVVADNGFGTQYRGYDMTVSGADVYVLVSTSRGTTLPSTNKRGTPHNLTVAGRQAREWAVDFWYDLSFMAGPSRVVSVSVEVADERPLNSTTSAAGLRTIGRHVARTVQLDADYAIGAEFELTYLPAGVTVGGVGRDVGQDTTYQLAARHADPDGSDAATVTADFEDASVGTNGAPVARGQNQAGRPVQGYATVVGHYGRTRTLTIQAFHHVPLVLTTGPGVDTLAELYRIADGIRWRG